MKKEILEKINNAQKNLIVNGDISTGKTRNVMLPLVQKIIDNNESLMILDSKEEYINKYYKELKEKNYNIVIINLNDLSKSEGWNPIEYPYNLYKKGDVDKSLDYLEKIGKVIFYENANVDPFWSSSASDLFTGINLGLFEDANEDEINFMSSSLMLEEANKHIGKYGDDSIRTYFESKSTTSQSYVYASPAIFAPPETRASICSVAKQKLRAYVSRNKLNNMMSKTTFDFDDICKKPTAVFFISKEDTKYLNSLAAMFIEQLYTILVDNKSTNKFNFILDNFDSIEIVNNLPEMLGTAISNNIRFSIVTRSKEQLFDIYGKYLEKLCNEITVSNILRVIINNDEQVIDNEFEENNYENVEITYPKLNNDEIKLFDFNKCIEKCKLKKLSDLNITNKNNVNVEELIKKIDEKIAELDKVKEEKDA